MSRVQVSGLSVSYGRMRVVRELDLDVPAGSIAAVVGRSGCGKSSLLRAIAGLHRPDAGSIAIGDRVVCGPRTRIPPEDRNIGLVPQEGALFPHLTVAQNIGFGLARAEADSRVEELLTMIGLPSAGHLRPHQLSGGMQQRVAVARALSRRPDVLLLDEPFSALDASLRESIRLEVLQLVRDAGATAILVTHDRDEAIASADTMAVMSTGRFIQTGRPMDVYASPASLEAARLSGAVVAVPHARRLDASSASTILGELPVCNSEVVEGWVVFRPEDLVLQAESQLDSQPGAVACEVVRVVFQGHFSLVTVSAQDLTFDVRCFKRRPPSEGDKVALIPSRPGHLVPA